MAKFATEKMPSKTYKFCLKHWKVEVEVILKVEKTG